MLCARVGYGQGQGGIPKTIHLDLVAHGAVTVNHEILQVSLNQSSLFFTFLNQA
jgi:hypothetical protein